MAREHLSTLVGPSTRETGLPTKSTDSARTLGLMARHMKVGTLRAANTALASSSTKMVTSMRVKYRRMCFKELVRSLGKLQVSNTPGSGIIIECMGRAT